MSRIPGIYGDLNDEQRAAYEAWMIAAVARVEHVYDCQDCSEPWPACRAGIAIHKLELERWSAWKVLRPGGGR